MDHLTAQQAETAAARLEGQADPESLDYMAGLDAERRRDLMALSWMGSDRGQPYGYKWHRDHMDAGRVSVEMTAENIRRGLLKLRTE